MKILIIGSEGFVGQNLVKGLSGQYDVFCADQVEKSRHQNYTRIDITDYDSVDTAITNHDAVIHLAAHSLVSSLDGSIANARVNIIGLLNLLESCRKKNINKVIFTSASSLVGEPSQYEVTEDHVPKPKTAYGITKLASEHYLRLYHELYNINYVVFRFFNIYGPFQVNGLIPLLYGRIKKNEPLTIFGKGDQIRDYVFIEDIIPFFEKAVLSQVANNAVFNMGTGKGTTIKQVVEMMSQIMGTSPKIENRPERPGEIGNFVADTCKLRTTFGITPETNVRTGLQRTIGWLDEHLGNH